VELDAALRYYRQHECIVFWNPRDITPENLATDMPDAEALMIEPGCITSCEAQDGQYLVKAGRLQQYESYPGHAGIDEVFIVLMRRPPVSVPSAAIEQCVRMGWQIMEATSGDNGIFFRRFTP
jgi:hypothetical protein